MLSGNPNITWDIVKNNPHKAWDYKMLSCNPNITWDIVRENPDKPWDYNLLWSNEQLTYKKLFIEKVSDIMKYFKNNVVEELMIYIWHPDRFDIWKNYDDY
jgi:hypothetical protein